MFEQTFKNIDDIPDQFLTLRAIFLQVDSTKPVVRPTMVPDHVHEPLAPVVIVEQRRVETTAVHVDRIAPFTVNGFAGRQVVMGVFKISVKALYVRVDEVKQAVAPGQAGSPGTT